MLRRDVVFGAGTQIAYIPQHAEGDIQHPDVEFGFILTDLGEDAYCRYYYANGNLRTRANSERTPKDCLVLHKHTPQEESPRTIEIIIKDVPVLERGHRGGKQ